VNKPPSHTKFVNPPIGWCETREDLLGIICSHPSFFGCFCILSNALLFSRRNRIGYFVCALHILRPTIRLYTVVYTERKKLAQLSHIHSYNPTLTKTLPNSFHCSVMYNWTRNHIYRHISGHSLVPKKSRWNYTKTGELKVNF
jgi:hypothetical protein